MVRSRIAWILSDDAPPRFRCEWSLGISWLAALGLPPPSRTKEYSMYLVASRRVVIARSFTITDTPHQRGNDHVHSHVLRIEFSRNSTCPTQGVIIARALTFLAPKLRGKSRKVSVLCPTQDAYDGSLVQAGVVPLTDHPRLAPTDHSTDRPTCPTTRLAVLPVREVTAAFVTSSKGIALQDMLALDDGPPRPEACWVPYQSVRNS